MQIVYNDITFVINALVEHDSKVSAPHGLSVFNGTVDEFEGFVRVMRDKRKGQDIINLFLAENKILDITNEESFILLEKFATIKAMLELGDIRSAHALTTALDIDSVFTEDRRSRYLLMMAKHLNYI